MKTITTTTTMMITITISRDNENENDNDNDNDDDNNSRDISSFVFSGIHFLGGGGGELIGGLNSPHLPPRGYRWLNFTPLFYLLPTYVYFPYRNGRRLLDVAQRPPILYWRSK